MSVPPPSANGAEIWTAIGTVGATITALGLALFAPARRWWRRPQLDVIVGPAEPFLMALHDGTYLAAEIFLRVGVHNAGRGEAHHVRAQLTRWWDAPGAGRAAWVDYDIDPTPLRWVSTGTSNLGGPYSADIPPKAQDYAEAFKYERSHQKLTLCQPEAARPRTRQESTYPQGEHRAEITVVAENARPVRRVISFITSHPNWVTDVKLGQAPQDAEVEHLGFLSILAKTRLSDFSDDRKL